jgi:adenine-specific DNA glycosylase
MVGFGQTICIPRVPKCGECKLADEAICPFAKKGLKMWKERQSKKTNVKTEVMIKEETKNDSTNTTTETVMTETRSAVKSETSEASLSLKTVKEEVISGYHVEHFS